MNSNEHLEPAAAVTAGETAQLTELEEWKQATQVEAGLRREYQEKCEHYIEALQRIVQWADCYPTNVFHEPTADESHRAHKLLTANGMTLDAFSASMARHCLKGVGDIARGALADQFG